MKVIGPSEISGKVKAPASKSHAQRIILLAALGTGGSRITNPSRCEDVAATLNVARALGAAIEDKGSEILVRGGMIQRTPQLDCGESGFCIRAAAPMAALFEEEYTLTGRGSLLARPAGMIAAPLKNLGVECSTAEGGLPPVTVKGPMKGGRSPVDGSTGAQVLSGLLMALPLCNWDSELRVVGLKSKHYTEMTLDAVRAFAGEVERDAEMTSFRIKGGQKYHSADIEIEGDWSSAAFLLAAGALCGEVTVEGLRPISRQADKSILNALTAARANVAWGKTGLKVTKGQLKGFQFDAAQCPDLIPPLVALACGCDGKSMIKGADRLKHRENERSSALWSELAKIGARVEVRGDWIIVVGHKPSGGNVDSHGDQRVAMACAVAGLISESGVTIDGEACVAKSYPDFFADLESVRLKK